MRFAGKHQVMIFVHSRKETAKTARFLKDKAMEEEMMSKFGLDAGTREMLQVRALLLLLFLLLFLILVSQGFSSFSCWLVVIAQQ